MGCACVGSKLMDWESQSSAAWAWYWVEDERVEEWSRRVGCREGFGGYLGFCRTCLCWTSGGEEMGMVVITMVKRVSHRC